MSHRGGTVSSPNPTTRPAEDVDLDTAGPLPKMAYDTVTTKTIRERLSEYSLPTEGEKPALVTRHQRLVFGG